MVGGYSRFGPSYHTRRFLDNLCFSKILGMPMVGQLLEMSRFYRFQIMMENIHSKTYVCHCHLSHLIFLHMILRLPWRRHRLPWRSLNG